MVFLSVFGGVLFCFVLVLKIILCLSATEFKHTPLKSMLLMFIMASVLYFGRSMELN